MPDWTTMRALLEGIPDLDGARCKGRSDLYEGTISEYRIDGQPASASAALVTNARSEALRLCNDGCPALDACRAWLGAMPAAQRPRGVVAGLVITSTGTPAKRTACGAQS
jgi:WhiB family transcriptional regulator, redox-sensing transcriptional regulator